MYYEKEVTIANGQYDTSVTDRVLYSTQQENF